MESAADILNLGTKAGRFFFRKRSKASSTLAQRPSWTRDRAQRGQPVVLRLRDHLLRRKRAVRKLGVEMQVGKPHDFTSLAGRISSLFTLSRMPFTNFPLSCVENFLAISTASLMLTTGGISSRCSIS